MLMERIHGILYFYIIILLISKIFITIVIFIKQKYIYSKKHFIIAKK